MRGFVFGAALLLAACGSSDDSGLGSGSGGSTNSGGAAGASAGGASSGGAAGSGASAGMGGMPGSGGMGTGGMGTGGMGTGGMGTGGMGTGGMGMGGMPGTGGGPAVTCQELDAAYQKALADAKLCAKGGATSPCTTKVDKDIACGCETFVNKNALTAIALMQQLQQSWNTKKCMKPCPDIACLEPASAECTSSGTGNTGKCTDVAAAL